MAITNDKGGVGKTTTAVNLGVALAMKRKKVQLVDCDPQGHLSLSLGIADRNLRRLTLTEHLEAMIAEEPLIPYVGITSSKEGVDIMPANKRFAGIDSKLYNVLVGRDSMMKNWFVLMEARLDDFHHPITPESLREIALSLK